MKSILKYKNSSQVHIWWKAFVFRFAHMAFVNLNVVVL